MKHVVMGKVSKAVMQLMVSQSIFSKIDRLSLMYEHTGFLRAQVLDLCDARHIAVPDGSGCLSQLEPLGRCSEPVNIEGV